MAIISSHANTQPTHSKVGTKTRTTQKHKPNSWNAFSPHYITSNPEPLCLFIIIIVIIIIIIIKEKRGDQKKKSKGFPPHLALGVYFSFLSLSFDRAQGVHSSNRQPATSEP